MKEPKRYYCGNGEGMFEDDKNGHWVEYSEHKAIVEALTEQLRKHAVVGRSEQLKCTCSRAKGLDHDEEGTPYCISCQKEVQ
jgi:hypothetical protein